MLHYSPAQILRRYTLVALVCALTLVPAILHGQSDPDRAEDGPADSSAQTEQSAEPVDGDPQSRDELNNYPDWFKQGTYISKDIEFLVVHTEPLATSEEASAAIGRTVSNAVRTRVESWTGSHDPHIMENLKIETDYLLRTLIYDDRQEVHPFHNVFFDEEKNKLVSNPDINLFCGYAQLKLTPEFKDEVDQRWTQYRTRSSLYTVASIGLGLLGLVTILFSYLRLNHATRGFYSRRLFMGAFIAAIVVILFCVSLINHV